MEVKIINNIRGRLYEALSPEWRIIQDIIWYFTEQGFFYTKSAMRSPLNPAIPTYINHELSFCNNLVSISINDSSFKIQLDINNLTYELKVNDNSLEELVRLIENNLDKMKEKNKSESN